MYNIFFLTQVVDLSVIYSIFGLKEVLNVTCCVKNVNISHLVAYEMDDVDHWIVNKATCIDRFTENI